MNVERVNKSSLIIVKGVLIPLKSLKAMLVVINMLIQVNIIWGNRVLMVKEPNHRVTSSDPVVQTKLWENQNFSISTMVHLRDLSLRRTKTSWQGQPMNYSKKRSPIKRINMRGRKIRQEMTTYLESHRLWVLLDLILPLSNREARFTIQRLPLVLIENSLM